MSSPGQKQVRFDLRDISYNIQTDSSASSSEVESEPEVTTSPPSTIRTLETPSPTHSTSTLSTTGPFTPPTAVSSVSFNSLSIQSKSTDQVPSSPHDTRIYPHSLLICPNSDWDLLYPPTKHVFPDLKHHGADNAIVYNPRRRPYLTLIAPLLPLWPLVIDLKEGVTLDDVLSAIFTHLVEPVTKKEFEKARKSDRILEAHARRCKDLEIINNGIIQRQEPLRRIDYFLGRRVFQKLEEVDGEPASWEIVLK